MRLPDDRIEVRFKNIRLLGLPPKVLVTILAMLSERDLKNFSLTCYGVLDIIEATRHLIPSMYVVDIELPTKTGTVHQILPLLTSPDEDDSNIPPDHNWLCSRETVPASLPTYEQTERASFVKAFRTRRPTSYREPQIWLCPHRSCTLSELNDIQPENFLMRIWPLMDTVSAVCPFPKCSLWARHALVTPNAFDIRYELRSVIRVYRFHCSSPEAAYEIANSEATRSRIQRAMSELHFNICSHLTLSDKFVLESLRTSQWGILYSSRPVVNNEFYVWWRLGIGVRSCEDCLLHDTWTKWSFIARAQRRETDQEGFWLDIEMMLCRAAYRESLETMPDLPPDQHWIHHAVQPHATKKYVDYWWKWAERVAEDGFDWRTTLKAGYLRRSKHRLGDFAEYSLRDQQTFTSSYKCGDKSKSVGKEVADSKDNNKSEAIAQAFSSSDWKDVRRFMCPQHGGTNSNERQGKMNAECICPRPEE